MLGTNIFQSVLGTCGGVHPILTFNEYTNGGGVISNGLIDNSHFELNDLCFSISGELSFRHAEQFEVNFLIVIAKFGA